MTRTTRHLMGYLPVESKRRNREVAAAEVAAEAFAAMAEALAGLVEAVARVANALEDDPTTLARRAGFKPMPQCASVGCTGAAMPGAALCADHMGGEARDDVRM